MLLKQSNNYQPDDPVNITITVNGQVHNYGSFGELFADTETVKQVLFEMFVNKKKLCQKRHRKKANNSEFLILFLFFKLNQMGSNASTSMSSSSSTNELPPSSSSTYTISKTTTRRQKPTITRSYTSTSVSGPQSNTGKNSGNERNEITQMGCSQSPESAAGLPQTGVQDSFIQKPCSGRAANSGGSENSCSGRCQSFQTVRSGTVRFH